MTILRCPQCYLPSGDDPAIAPTNDDGTADDTAVCFTCAELMTAQADDYY